MLTDWSLNFLSCAWLSAGTQMTIYTARKLLIMICNKKVPLPELLSGNGIVEFELSKPHSAPKYPFKNSNQKGGAGAGGGEEGSVLLTNIPMHMKKMSYRYISLSLKRHFKITIRHSLLRVNLQSRN